MIPKIDSVPARRKFLQVAGLGGLGFLLPNSSLARVWSARRAGELLFYVGTYTSGKSEGIYLYRFNPSSGELKHVTTTKGVKDPSYLALSPNGRFLYAVNEVEDFENKKSGALSAFAIDPKTRELKLLNQKPSSGGAPCYVVVDRTGKFVLVANYVGGNVAVLPVRSDGGLNDATDVQQFRGSSIDARQEGPHAHCIVPDHSNRFAYACDLGTDRIMIFRFDSRRGRLIPGKSPWVQLSPGAGPRHLTFHPGGKYAYVVNELHATVTAFAHDRASGNLIEVQTVPTLPQGFTTANTSADIHISPDGRFLYSSNRGHDSVAAFRVDPRNGTLTFIAHESTGGKAPRNFVIDPTGAFVLVANQKSDNIVVFRRDRNTGRLSATGHVADVPSPVCLKFIT